MEAGNFSTYLIEEIDFRPAGYWQTSLDSDNPVWLTKPALEVSLKVLCKFSYESFNYLSTYFNLFSPFSPPTHWHSWKSFHYHNYTEE